MARKKTKIAATDPTLERAGRILAESSSPPPDLMAEYGALAEGYRALLRKLNKTLVISDTYQMQLREMMKQIEDTTYKYRQLKDVALPLCIYCKNIRTDNDYWQRLETYFGTHAEIMFSHGICPECIKSTTRQLGAWQHKEKFPDLPASAEPSAGPAAPAARKPAEDETLKELRTLLQESAAAGNPLTSELERVVGRHAKLVRRFNKIVSISDGYQSQLMELNARLEFSARTDLLTGLANRWEIMARLESEKSRSERYHKHFSILLCDLDHFKAINDGYGHMAGDRVLRAIAEVLRTHVRAGDFCGRWGGEEFLVILPETDLPKARTVAEKLLVNMRKTAVPWEGRKITTTMSVGLGAFRPGMSIDECLKKVDDALFAAKAGGRDRLMMVAE
ncbi:GGDEF domain-containing protein [Geobacter sp. FeAm09]|uniref:diguanylate cyclase n=1 Tax=Geobacter sp. FeAm09 TaxID=2597769 RepID=UPI0011EF0642|nr:diguanylate cyclase [Geobacter sp. FeAm09]QEM69298.1 GGDEF domain-containing protein [Geobacter sp. FeAm09]